VDNLETYAPERLKPAVLEDSGKCKDSGFLFLISNNTGFKLVYRPVYKEKML